MIEALGKWIVSICIAIFFTTAVQMILPDNSIKKYCNFVLGLIVFAVMITPVIEFLNSDINVSNLIEESVSSVFNGEKMDENYDEYRQANVEATIKTFKKNIENQCEEDLKKNFKDKSYKADFQVTYDEKNNNFTINSVEIVVNSGLVEKIKDVRIGEESMQVDNREDELDEAGIQVKEYISEKYDVDKDSVYVYKAD